MHYIRFLKVPRLSQPGRLRAVVTITTDLGDSFLATSIPLLVTLADSHGGRIASPTEYLWKGTYGHRGLPIEIPVGKQAMQIREGSKMCIHAKDTGIRVDNWQDILPRNPGSQNSPEPGRVVGVSGPLFVNGVCERVFNSTSGPELYVWEETGESIARHIWDAGLVLSAYLTRLCREPGTDLPILRGKLAEEDLKVLELGAGCGIVGITLSRLGLHHVSKIVLTDLDEASDILAQNLSSFSPTARVLAAELESRDQDSPEADGLSTSLPNGAPSPPLSNVTIPTHQVLDWSLPLPLAIASISWNLVLVADCTYNPDVVPSLIATLGHLSHGNPQLTVLLAMKVRHESEAVFFELMAQQRWVVRESCRVDLPVLGAGGEVIEIFVYGRV
ncbi:hypothetical protein B2J93_2655 [Marssonina coronariae]|uniref:Uncharacterized protein n=1 Tax=Diplocarpon coronariae TaxID=2795749 RepID=A0A218Z878_9HELO|nr:hypothetical protein B2J93_2655 [Marssonina coronariae]